MTAFTTTAFLTKLVANPAHRDVQRDLADIQRMHSTITTLACRPDFGPSTRAAAGLLYRVEHTSTGVQILMQSATQPSADRLSAGYDIARTADLGPLMHHLHDGLNIRYRITTNPIKNVFQRGQRGTHQPLHGDDANVWWHNKATLAGLTNITIHSTTSAKLTGKRNKPPKDVRITLHTTTFEGIATIADNDTLQLAILNGIGRGRAYGCGLLSLAPLR
jgi:CRISPR system Cascade subunit CasE